MEMLDILDEQGQVTGRIGPKAEVKEGGHWHRVVNVWIMDPAGRFLMQKRTDTLKYFPGYWSTVGGHVSAGESSLETARREVAEELGLEFSAGELEFLFTDKAIYPHGPHQFRVFRDVWLAVWQGTGEEVKADPREVAAVEWQSLETVKTGHESDDGVYFPLPSTYLNRFWQEIGRKLNRRVV